MKSICFFSSYYTVTNIPGYVKFYLNELKRHFSEVILLTNEKNIPTEDIQYLASNNIPYRLYKNEGFDFGMWYKAFQEYDVMQYDRIGLVNDSCILFNKLDFYFNWLDKQEADYSGFTDCYRIGYHIQSYFIIINKRAIPFLAQYFNENGIVKNIKDVIKIYEINLCNFLLKKNMHLKVYYPLERKGDLIDPSWIGVKELIKKGMPLIKKKIIIREYGDANREELALNGFDPFPNHYISLIKKMNHSEDSTNEIFKGIRQPSSLKNSVNILRDYCNLNYCIVRYHIKNLLRPSYMFIKKRVKI